MPRWRSIIRRYNDDALQRYSHLVNGRVLDVGSGTYDNKQFFKCMDYLRLDIGRKCAPDVVSNLENAALRSSSFDAVICSHVLEHVMEPKKVVKEMHRILKPGGVLLASGPFVLHLHPDPVDMLRFTPDGLKHLFRDFSLETIECLGGYFSVLAVMADDFFNIFIKRRASGILYRIGKALDSVHVLPKEKRHINSLGNTYFLCFLAVCRKVQK